MLQTFSRKEIEIIGRWEEQGRTFLKVKNKKYIISKNIFKNKKKRQKNENPDIKNFPVNSLITTFGHCDYK